MDCRLHGFPPKMLTGIWAAVLVLAAAVVVPVFAYAEETVSLTAEEAYDAWLAEVKRFYEKAKAAGERVPDDVAAWFRDEVKKVGAWEYKVVELQDTFATELEGQLNELGKERWEVFWVENQDKRLRIFLKRPTKTYLRNIPTRDLLRLVPSGPAAAD